MSNFTKLLQQASAGTVGEALPIEDVFSTYLYTGNGSTQTITNGIDLSGKGGLVWLRWRSGGGLGSASHALLDTNRGKNTVLQSNRTDQQDNTIGVFASFNNNGFSLNGDASGWYNYLDGLYTSWTFRKAPRFFDVVTYTGDGTSGRQIAHNLRIAPGCIIVKNRDTASDWAVFHNGISGARTDALFLNKSDIKVDSAAYWNDTDPTDTVFTVGNDLTVNASGDKYVAYLFADDPLGPSGDGSDGLIATGNYIGTGVSTPITVTLGWEPQWLLVKTANTASRNWSIIDVQRGMDYNSTSVLKANLSDAETSQLSAVKVLPDGFQITTTDPALNETNAQMIYIAIRRGLMREPTDGTNVFKSVYGQNTDTTKPSFISGFETDFAIRVAPESSTNREVVSRLTGYSYLQSNSTDPEYSRPSNFLWDYSDGFATGYASNNFAWLWRRAKGFFDAVYYTGDGISGRTVKHNLGVAPEMIWVKRRDSVASWFVYSTGVGVYNSLNLEDSRGSAVGYWANTAPTDTVFTLDSSSNVNGNTDLYIAYLFATLPGVSKVGSYTGNGSSQTIDCGFSSGARFVLIKRYGADGNWYVWDSVRGIVSGNDPHLSLDVVGPQVTTDDSIDPNSSGFTINQTAATNINVSSATYIFYAIA